MPTEIQPPRLGRLIVLEGADGSGKTTLAEALVKRLLTTGSSAAYFSFPGREPGSLGAEVYKLHHRVREAGTKPVHPVSLQLLHIAAHVDAIETRILPMLRKNIDVVLDRFWWSTWVYGIVGGGNAASLKAMIEVEQLYWRAIRPAVVFLVVRKQARPGDDELLRSRHIEEYRRLSAVERNDYPVRVVENDGTLAMAVAEMARELVFIAGESGTLVSIATAPQAQFEFSNEPRKTMGAVFTRLAPAKTTLVYETYWRFACERQNIFFARLENRPWPWTEDAVLREYKFTNAYRASDRVSQYLIRNVIYEGDRSPNELFFRVLLFKVFNRIETWELLRREFGEITFREYSFRRFDRILTDAMAKGARIYSAAYIMPSGGHGSAPGRKHSMHLRLIETMIRDGLPEKIASARSMAKAFELIREYPTIGDFLAYQYVTDLNYSPLTSFSEMEFVMPGPGALGGIRKCFSDQGGLTEAELVKVVTERQEQEFERLGLSFKNLWGRSLQLIDCQNLFCEVDKYARVKHPEFSGLGDRIRIKQRFKPTPVPLTPWYPPKWKINEKIASGGDHVRAV
jgi:thymidylate kinase